MPRADLVLRAAGTQLLECVDAHGLEQAIPLGAVRLLIGDDQRLVDQARQEGHDLVWHLRVISAYRLGSLQHPAACEHRQPFEEALLASA
jgi:hypothetical protein